MTKQEMPDWAIEKPGDPAKQTGELGAWDRIKRALFPENYHVRCGGRWRGVGSSGLFTHTVYSRCDRCGAQDGGRFISQV